VSAKRRLGVDQDEALSVHPWWTAADEAELDVIVHEFVTNAFRHRDGCPTCHTGGPWCRSLREAFDVVVEWRDGRVLRSKAAWLREREQEREWAA
jgi:hypothetical protein